MLTHALVYAINACLSSSFLPTVRGFGSRFGPIAKWPFPNETSFRKEPHFAHVPKTLKIFQSFLNFHFVKNESKSIRQLSKMRRFARSPLCAQADLKGLRVALTFGVLLVAACYASWTIHAAAWYQATKIRVSRFNFQVAFPVDGNGSERHLGKDADSESLLEAPHGALAQCGIRLLKNPRESPLRLLLHGELVHVQVQTRISKCMQPPCIEVR